MRSMCEANVVVAYITDFRLLAVVDVNFVSTLVESSDGLPSKSINIKISNIRVLRDRISPSCWTKAHQHAFYWFALTMIADPNYWFGRTPWRISVAPTSKASKHLREKNQRAVF